eukprot:1437553-Pleurochrysis_carterae.AAC.2
MVLVLTRLSRMLTRACAHARSDTSRARVRWLAIFHTLMNPVLRLLSSDSANVSGAWRSGERRESQEVEIAGEGRESEEGRERERERASERAREGARERGRELSLIHI